MSYHCCQMANPLNLPPLGIGNITAAVLAYIGGVLTKPLQDYITFVRRRHEIRLCLYTEVGWLISTYEHSAYHTNLPIRVHSTNEAYKLAMQFPEVYYSLKERFFFEGLYRIFLNFDGRRRKPIEARTMLAAIDEQILLGNVDRKFLRKQCDENGRRHIDLLPKRVFKSPAEFDAFIQQFS